MGAELPFDGVHEALASLDVSDVSLAVVSGDWRLAIDREGVPDLLLSVELKDLEVLVTLITKGSVLDKLLRSKRRGGVVGTS